MVYFVEEEEGKMPMTYEEFMAREKDEPKLCPMCKQPIGPRVDGEHLQIQGKEVCNGCYFEQLGKVVERRPDHS